MMSPTIVLMGGFGNQMFQLAYALERYPCQPFNLETSLARASLEGNGKLDLQSYVLPSHVSVVNVGASRLTRKLINLVLRMSISKASTKVKFGFVAGIGLLFKVKVRQHHRIVCSSGLGFSKLNHQEPRENDLVIGYFQSSRFASKRVLETLKKMEYTKRIEGYEKFHEIAATLKPIVVHVRLGDYELEKGIGLLPNSYYLEAIHLAHIEFPNSPIWIFSNDMPKTMERFKDFKFKDMVFVEDNWNSASATFEVMRLGSAYIIANSSFSYWAAMLSKNPNPLVIAPKPWFQASESPNEILPANWKTIQTK